MNTTILYSLGNTLKIPISDSDGRSGSATLEINSDPHEAAVISQTVSVLNGEGVFELSEDEKKKLKIGNYVYRIIFTDTDSITTEWSGIFAVIYGAANEKNGVLIPSKLNIEVVNSPNSAISPGIYAIEDETVVFNTKYRQILIVSEYIEPAMGEETILQALFDAERGAIKLRKRVDYSWSDWETVGETDLSEYIKNTDYATSSNFGVVKIGTGIKSVDGVIQTDIANETLIMGRNSSASINEVITPSNLNFAVKSALSDDRRISDMTDAEKANARGVIGALGASVLNDYYTKSQVDSKLSSVYKFKGTAIVPLELGYKTVEQGDVYNCQVGGNFCPYIKQSALDLVSMNLDSVNKEITLNFATSMSDILASPDVVIDTVYIAENIARTNGFVYGDVVDNRDNYITVNYSQYVTALQVPYDGIDPVDMFHYYTNQTLEAGDKVTIECFIGVLKSTYYNTGDEKVSVNNGGNVAWTGTTWDNLGGYIDISAKADKSATLSGYGIADAYTKAEVDGKIAAAIETALNTEV